jgi:superfamily I DNA/RNA helicase
MGVLHPAAATRPAAHPALDVDQSNAYADVLDRLRDPTTGIITVCAGAGSGKTRLMVALLNAFLKQGRPPEEIAAISFTNASSDDFQAKHIRSQLDALDPSTRSDTDQGLVNLSFSTIHQFALDLLKMLEPHVGGVAYYFQDADISSYVADDGSDEGDDTRRAMWLAIAASTVYSESGRQFLTRLADFAEHPALSLIRFNSPAVDLVEEAETLIRKQMMTDAGLGAFTNTDDTSPDYALAVATDALLRLYRNSTADVNTKRRIFGIPAVICVDEAQDTDLTQMLFLRALMLNGAQIVMVGDSMQTLYEWRQAVSDLPFRKEFLNVVTQGTGRIGHVCEHVLRNNYRCRREIIHHTEDFTRRLVSYSHERWEGDQPSENLNPISDPEVRYSVRAQWQPTDENPPSEHEKRAVSVVIGGAMKPRDVAQPSLSVGVSGSALGRLEALRQIATPEGQKKSPPKRKLCQLEQCLGGENETFIRERIKGLLERARLGETVGILGRKRFDENDVHLLREMLDEDELEFEFIAPLSSAVLADYWLLNRDGKAQRGVPFTSLMLSSVLTYFFSFDGQALDQTRDLGLKSLNRITAGPVEEIRARMERERPQILRSIQIETASLFKAIDIHWNELLGDEDMHQAFQANREALQRICARFTLEVILRYAQLHWQRTERFEVLPCRFHYVATLPRTEGQGLRLRSMRQTKQYLKLFWQALASTRFALEQGDYTIIEAAGLVPEWMELDTTLVNYAEHLVRWYESGGEDFPDGRVIRSRGIPDRETIHDQCSRLYHKMTRVYMRTVGRGLGRLIRAHSGYSEDALHAVAYAEYYRDARYKAVLDIRYRERSNKYAGLFEALSNGVSDIQTRRAPVKTQAKMQGRPRFDLSTVHSAKGLEWDHVLFLFPGTRENRRPGSKPTSFRAWRDIVYVAMTRARKTLTIIPGKRAKSFRESGSDTPGKVGNWLLHEYAEAQALYNRPVDFPKASAVQEEPTHDVTICRETTHSELERAMACRILHDIHHRRQLASMNPISKPAYAFFFHNALASIAAALLGQRITLPQDPVREVADVVAELAVTQVTEREAYQRLSARSWDAVSVLMDQMVPIYNYADHDHFQLIRYYTDGFLQQIAAIVAGTELFRNLRRFRNDPQAVIRLEKPVRSVLRNGAGTDYYMPVSGIPDVQLDHPELIYTADFKTMPRPGDDEEIEDYQRRVSNKTSMQVTLYQGMASTDEAKPRRSELIYVADLTVPEHEDIPGTVPVLPQLEAPLWMRRSVKVDHAQVIYADRFDLAVYEEALERIQHLRALEGASEYLPAADVFSPSPRIGEECEVTAEDCRLCAVAIHCTKNKMLQEWEG